MTGNCFRCGQAGHWANDCPPKLDADVSPPEIHCHCGGGICEVKVSNTRENPGRKFYKCPGVQNCKFFKWCDKVTDKDIEYRPPFMIPICRCGAGPCRKFEDDSGRAYLICCIKKGFGSCGFFEWEDVMMLQNCDDRDEIDFLEEADQIMSDMESSLKAGGAPEKERQASGSAEDDSILENLDSMSVSDVHSATLNQGIPLLDPVVIEPEDPCKQTLHGDQPTNCALSNLSVDEALSDLNRDIVSGYSGVNHETTSHEQPIIGEVEWPFPNLQELIEQKLQFESVSGKHVQAMSAFMASFRQLKLLKEKTCHLRKMLLETEQEMACCEAETVEFGASWREVTGEMAESHKKMMETVFKQNEFVAIKRRRS